MPEYFGMTSAPRGQWLTTNAIDVALNLHSAYVQSRGYGVHWSHDGQARKRSSCGGSMWSRGIGYVVLALGIGVAAPINAIAGCQTFLGFDNLYREVWGPVNAECRTWLGHTPPFGNWGVESPVSSRTDGDQFPGWKLLGGHHEWNSCTGEYPPPSEDNYNYPDGVWTSQYTTVGEMRFGYGSNEIMWGGDCTQLSGIVQTVVQYTMDIYELDPLCCGDEQVGSLTYPEQSFVWLCAGSGTSAVCNGDAWPWVEPIDGATAFTAIADAWGHAQYHIH